MCGNKRNERKPNHVVTAWSREDGYSLGQQAIDEKSRKGDYLLTVKKIRIELFSHAVREHWSVEAMH